MDSSISDGMVQLLPELSGIVLNPLFYACEALVMVYSLEYLYCPVDVYPVSLLF